MPDWEKLCDQLRYLAYAEETCPTTQKKHFQAFAYAKAPMRFGGWKELFPTAHIEKMKGNFAQNEKYCSKEGKLIEFGERPTHSLTMFLLAAHSWMDAGCNGLARQVQKRNLFEKGKNICSQLIPGWTHGVTASHDRCKKKSEPQTNPRTLKPNPDVLERTAPGAI
jgi:hypothetical protein